MAAKKKTDASAKKPLIKFFVTREDQDVIRLAAALKRSSMADFARAIVLKEADRLAKGIAMPKGT